MGTFSVTSKGTSYRDFTSTSKGISSGEIHYVMLLTLLKITLLDAYNIYATMIFFHITCVCDIYIMVQLGGLYTGY